MDNRSRAEPGTISSAALIRTYQEEATKQRLLVRKAEPKERLDYLRKERRDYRNVIFQAVFLQALGRLCFSLGQKAGWDPGNSLLENLDKLSPASIDYRAARKWQQTGEDTVVTDWNSDWRNAMMKPSTDSAGNVTNYTFNNGRENISATANLLARKVGIEISESEDGGLAKGKQEQAA